MLVQNVHAKPRRQPNLMSDINVTPFVDVMLVLLVIFMVTSPMLVTGIGVDLPEVSSKAISQQEEPLSISITSKGLVYLQNTSIKEEELVQKLRAITKENTNTQIIIQASKQIDYGHVMRVLGNINAAGFTKVALRTESTG